MDDPASRLAAIEWFAGLEDPDRAALARLCRWHRFAADQQIIGHLDETGEVYFILEGEVRAIVYSASGKQVSFSDLSAGQSFGELSAIDGAPRSATVVARSDTSLASMSSAAFLKVLNDHPDVSARVVRHLVAVVRALSDRVVMFSVLPVRVRVRAELLRLARDSGIADNRAVVRPVPTHADIASRLSTHREAVTREMNALARAGLIDRADGALTIVDVARLDLLVETGSLG